MKNSLRSLVSYFYSFLGPFLNEGDCRVLMYHSIQEFGKSMWITEYQNFQDQVYYVLNHKKKYFCACDELLKDSPKNSIVLTFDDGYVDNFQFVAPMLLSLNIPFCIFVITDYVKSGKEGYMDEKMLIELSRNPLITIGSHTKSHPRLAECTYNQAQEELQGSKKYLEDLLSKEITCFSYPHGSVSNNIKGQVIDAGYKLGFTSHFDVNNPSQDKYLLNRNEIWGFDSLDNFIGKISGSYDWMKYKS